MPFVERVAGHVNLRVQQLDVKVETKTSDNVFVHVLVAVQFHVLKDKIYEAFYKLDDPTSQIKSFVFDVVRARVPTIKLDDVFEKKDEIADAVKLELREMMEDFGYGIVKALVTDIDPDHKVKESMNEINAAQRLAGGRQLRRARLTRFSRSKRPKRKRSRRPSLVRASPISGERSSTVCASR